MEWSGRCRLTIALLVVLLLALRNASAMAPGDGARGGLAVAPNAGRKSLAGGSPTMGREPSAGDDLLINYSDENAVTRARAHDDAKRTDTRKSARRNTENVFVSYKKKLKIAVPHKHGFQAFVNITHPNTAKQKVTGYSIDVFKTALEKLNDPPQYEFYAFDGTYDELVRNVSKGVYDAAVGDVTITAERVMKAEFTMPYLQSGLSLLVRCESDSKPIQWIFLKPLTKELWIATVVGFFFTGFVVWTIEHPRNPAYQGSSLRQVSNAAYFAFSTLTFSHEQIIRSPLSKIAIVVWCFAVLVLVQSYTANLSSMLTAKRLRPVVTDLNQMVLNGEYIGCSVGTFAYSFLKKEGVPEKKIRDLTNQAEYAEALRKGSKNGGVSAIVEEIPYLTYFLLDPQYKKEFQMVNHIYSYRTPGLGFVFSPGSPLVHNLSISILELTQGNEVSEIEARWLGSAARITGSDSHVADSAPLTLQSFSGLFVITGCVSTLMLLIRIAWSVYARYNRTQASGLQTSDGEYGSANLGESNAAQEDLGYGSIHDQNNSEDRSDHSVQDHSSRISVGNAEPCQIHNASVTVYSVPIDTGQGVGLAL